MIADVNNCFRETGLMLSRFVTSVKSAKEAERILKLPVLGSIPTGEGSSGLQSTHTPHAKWQSAATAGAVRSLRDALRFAVPPGAGNAILITSAERGEGKTSCAIQIAVALAQSGGRTLLVDADLHHPDVESRILPSPGRPGLADFVFDARTFSHVITSSPIAHLDIVAAGARTRRSDERGHATRLDEFFDTARRLYDWVIVDSAETNATGDVLWCARHAQAICLVVRVARTRKSIAQKSVDRMSKAGTRPTGVILNFARPSFPRLRGSEQNAGPSPTSEARIRDFPKICPSCNRVFLDVDDYLTNTTRAEDTGAPSSSPGSDLDVRWLRACPCGTAIIVSGVNRRDPSDMGQTRRQVFGELLDRLMQGGAEREEARSDLMLTLKIWRNELAAESHLPLEADDSEAALQRRELFCETLDDLVKAGLSRDEAQDQLLSAIRVWRDGV